MALEFVRREIDATGSQITVWRDGAGRLWQGVVQSNADQTGIINPATEETLALLLAALADPATETTLAALLAGQADLNLEATQKQVRDRLPAVLGQGLVADSLAVVLPSDQIVPVSAASLPLPAGAATEATLAALLAAAATETTLGTRASETTAAAILAALGPLATETTLAALLSGQGDLATEATALLALTALQSIDLTNQGIEADTGAALQGDNSSNVSDLGWGVLSEVEAPGADGRPAPALTTGRMGYAGLDERRRAWVNLGFEADMDTGAGSTVVQAVGLALPADGGPAPVAEDNPLPVAPAGPAGLDEVETFTPAKIAHTALATPGSWVPLLDPSPDAIGEYEFWSTMDVELELSFDGGLSVAKGVPDGASMHQALSERGRKLTSSVQVRVPVGGDAPSRGKVWFNAEKA